MKNLGDKVRYVRDNVRGWTTYDLSIKANVSQPYVSQIENGDRVPSAKTINKLAEALNVPSAFLMDDNVVTLDEFYAAEKLKGLVDEKKYLPYFVAVDRAMNYEISPDELLDAIEFVKRHKKSAN